jgi:hypothetical protein
MDVVLSVVVAATFAVTGGVKVLGVRQSLEIRDQLGMAPSLWRVIGTLELLGAAGVLAGLAVPVLGSLALAGLVLLMLGAIASRLRVHDRLVMVAADAAVLALVVATLVVHLNA